MGYTRDTASHEDGGGDSRGPCELRVRVFQGLHRPTKKLGEREKYTSALKMCEQLCSDIKELPEHVYVGAVAELQDWIDRIRRGVYASSGDQLSIPTSGRTDSHSSYSI